MNHSILRETDLGTLKLLSLARTIFMKHWWAVVLITLIPIGFDRLLSPVIDWLGALFPMGREGWIVIPTLIYVMVLLLVQTLARAAIAFVVDDEATGQGPKYQQALTRALSRALSIVVTSVFAFLILSVLYLLFIIPGIIWSLYYSFYIYAVALRGLSGKAAQDYSKSLVEGQWWMVYWIYVGLGLIFGFAATTIEVVAGDGLLRDILSALVTSLFVVTDTIFFLNLDYLRRESSLIKGSEPVLIELQLDQSPQFPGSISRLTDGTPTDPSSEMDLAAALVRAAIVTLLYEGHIQIQRYQRNQGKRSEVSDLGEEAVYVSSLNGKPDLSSVDGELEKALIRILLAWDKRPEELSWPNGPSIFAHTRAIFAKDYSSPAARLINFVANDAANRQLIQGQGKANGRFEIAVSKWSKLKDERAKLEVLLAQLQQKYPDFYAALSNEIPKAINSRVK